jgi:hypothetical protein
MPVARIRSNGGRVTEIEELGKRKKHDDHTPVERGGSGRKLSEIIKELALRALKDPDAIPSPAAAQTALLLATTAWNMSWGDPSLPDELRKVIGKTGRGGASPWEELLSADTDRLIRDLFAYKLAHYANDRRRIVAAEMSPEGNLRVHWVDGEKPGTALVGSRNREATAAGADVSLPIAKKLIARMKREVGGKVIDIQNMVAGRAFAEDLQKTVATSEELAGLHPAHAAYVYAQNQVSVLSEQLTGLDELAPLADMIAKAEDLYMPGGPPMSPLTTSYFTCWALFDAYAGAAHETIGATVLQVGAAFGMHAELLRLIRLMQESRMGLYVHEGTASDLVMLRDFVTGNTCRAISPAGYLGKEGELWYARVLPPPSPGGSEHIVFTTPYIVLEPGLRGWQAYFRRTLPDAPQPARVDAYKRHMKYGPTRAYWNDFLFESYVNHRTEVIYLAGFPDVPESRPHSQVNEWGFGLNS